MPEANLGRRLKPTDKIRFLESHRPDLEDGVYSVEVEHAFEVHAKSEHLTGRQDLSFVVAGPRFAIAPSDISGVFPPRGSRGKFEAVLPHILLNRPSLPWERSAEAGAGRDGPPWLALLVLEEKEVLSAKTVKAKSLLSARIQKTTPSPGPRFAKLARGPADDGEQSVQLLELSVDTANKILPELHELGTLTGVRDVNGKDPQALVVANRLPAEGARNVVHLVSLEASYQGDPRKFWANGKSRGTVELVSLANWSFFCESSDEDLASLLKYVSIDILRMPIPKLDQSIGPAQMGAVPLHHCLADGKKTASWFHGPLTANEQFVAMRLPVMRGEDLLFVDKATGLLDVSYAAAWELGRLLALKDPNIGIKLNQWKRQVAHAERKSKAKALAPETMQEAPVSPLFPFRDWFEHALARFVSVPFRYLVPEASLLPEESLRFFKVDRNWVAALFDGAFSIGRTTTADQESDALLRGVLPALPIASGVLLRSKAVAGWPHLLVDGYQSGNADTASPVLRFERLASDTLLVLFEGHLSHVDIHLHPQAIHFGLDGNSDDGFQKAALPVAFREEDNPVPSKSKTGDARVLKIAELQTSLGAQGSHDFADKMREEVPKVSYQIREQRVGHV